MEFENLSLNLFFFLIMAVKERKERFKIDGKEAIEK